MNSGFYFCQTCRNESLGESICIKNLFVKTSEINVLAQVLVQVLVRAHGPSKWPMKKAERGVDIFVFADGAFGFISSIVVCLYFVSPHPVFQHRV